MRGVATGAADGYYVWPAKPALYSAALGRVWPTGCRKPAQCKKGRSGVVNIGRDMRSRMIELDAPLTSDIEGSRGPVSHWVHTSLFRRRMWAADAAPCGAGGECWPPVRSRGRLICCAVTRVETRAGTVAPALNPQCAPPLTEPRWRSNVRPSRPVPTAAAVWCGGGWRVRPEMLGGRRAECAAKRSWLQSCLIMPMLAGRKDCGGGVPVRWVNGVRAL